MKGTLATLWNFKALMYIGSLELLFARDRIRELQPAAALEELECTC